MGSHDVQEFCLRWNNHHSTLVSVLDSLLVRESLVDVVLAAEGKFIKVHRFVLFACSNYFQDMLSQQLDKQAVVFMKDVRFNDLKALVDFMYKGEVNISQYQLESFLQTAEALQIKGLADKPNQKKVVSNNKSTERKAKINAGKATESSGDQQQQNSLEDSQASHPAESQTSKPTPQRSKATKRPAPKALEMEEETPAEEPPAADTSAETSVVKTEEPAEEEDEMEMNPTVDDDQEYNSDQESIQEEDEGWSAGNSNSASDYPSGAPSLHEGMGNETWASENGAGTSENNYDLTMSDSSIGGDGIGADGSGLTVIEDDDGGERPFSCPRCGRRYKRKNNAVAHLRYECGVVPSFPCPICSHMLSQRRYIQKHIRRKHPDYIQEYEEQKKLNKAPDDD